MDSLKKKRIGLVLHPYGEKEAAGLGRSIFRLTDAIIKNDPTTTYVVYIKGTTAPDPSFSTTNYEVCRLGTGLFWLDNGFLRQPKLDAYVFFTPVTPFFARVNPSVVVVHDLGYRHIKASNFHERWTRVVLAFVHGWSLRRASAVIAVSEYTKNEIHTFYPKIPSEKIHVVYNGYESLNLSTEEPISVTKPFFLFVGVMKKRKNVVRIIKAFELFKQKTKTEHVLVLVGKGGDKDVERAIEESPCRSSIVQPGYVSSAQLTSLYKEAEAFVFPSLLEGFGMPILEAMSAGAPVITSNRDAPKEIAGDAALLVDPESVQSIADGMEKISRDIDFRQSLIVKGKERAVLFSWQKAGVEYLNVIRTCIL